MSDRTASASGHHPPPLEGAGSISEPEQLRATRRRQAIVTDAVSSFGRAAHPPKADDAERPAQNARLSSHPRPHADLQANDGELIERTIASGPFAPRLARGVVAQCLGERVATPVLENAKLLMSELVTNSVRHSGVQAGDGLVVRVRLSQDTCRLEVEDPGHEGMIATRPPNMLGGGMGLNLVEMLSEHWGVVRGTDGPTRVWAQLSCATALV